MTILEAAQKLGVTKTAIRKYLTDEFRERYCSSRPNGAINISSEGVALIEEKMTANSDQKPTTNSDQKPTGNPVSDAVIDILRRQLEEKDRQIEKQQEQISQLTAALEHTTSSLQAAQALHAGTMQKQLLTDGSEQEAEADAPESEPVPTKKKHWWNRK